MELIVKPEHGTTEWLRGRQRDENGKTIVGGSDAPALMNESPYKTRADLYLDKISEPVAGEFNMAFHRGQVLEPALVAEASRVLKTALLTPNVMYRDGRWNINSDAVDNEDCPAINIECKTTTRYAINSADDLPREWRWQGWAQMAVMDVPVFFSVLDKFQSLAVVELPRNDYAIELLLLEAERFCSSIDANAGYAEFIDDMTAEQIASIVSSTQSAIELPESALTLVRQLAEARETRKEAELLEKFARDEIARLLTEHDTGTVNGQPIVSWKSYVGKKTLDVSALRAAHPEIVAQFERAGSPYRTMRIINNKETKK